MPRGVIGLASLTVRLRPPYWCLSSSLIAFRDSAGADGRSVGLIYLYKQGTFYPFVPTGPQQRDNLLEINVRSAIEGDLPVEKDLSRWLAVWGAPGL